MNFFFAWYDLWIGAYWNKSARVLHVGPLPCCVFQFYSRLGTFNFCVMQWFGVRLARVIEGVDGEGMHKVGEQVGWSLVGFVLPMSGWRGKPYIGKTNTLVSRRWK